MTANSRMPSPWTWRSDHNPYRQTPFQVLGLSPDVRGRAAIKARIKNRRTKIRNAPERFLLFGRTVSEAEINAAETLLEEPEGRVYAELCTHRPRQVASNGPAPEARLADLIVPDVRVPITVDPARLRRLVPAPVRRVHEPLVPW